MSRIFLPVFLLCAVSLVSPAIAQVPPPDKPGDPITYRRLTWNDFRVDDKVAGMAAQTHTFITFNFRCRSEGRSGSYTASAIDVAFDGGFDRMRSWRRSSVTEKSEQLLTHEQGHFDIAELKLRQLRRWKSEDLPQGQGTSSEEAVADLRKKLHTLYRTQVEELEKIQKRYDEETNHGTRREVQQQWTQRLARALELLPPVSVARSTANTAPTPARERQATTLEN